MISPPHLSLSTLEGQRLTNSPSSTIILHKYSAEIPAATQIPRESCPEHHTNSAAKEFLKACNRCLQEHLIEAAWFPKHFRIMFTFYLPKTCLIIREKHPTKIRQSNPENNIVAESDGGLIIYPSSSRKRHCPVLIVEVTFE